MCIMQLTLTFHCNFEVIIQGSNIIEFIGYTVQYNYSSNSREINNKNV